MPHPNDHTLAAVLDDRFGRSVSDAEINCDADDDDKLMIRRQDNGGGMLQHLPAKSFLVSLSEYNLFNGNAFINRKKSYRGNAGPNSAPKPNPIVRQLPRIGKSKVSLMISLPQSQNLVDASTVAARSPRLFQKPPRESSKSSAEPTSPEVSCTGRVRSKKRPDKKLSWLLSGFRAVFGGKPRAKPRPSVEDRYVDESFQNSRSVEPEAGRNLRIMERFTSSRRLQLLN